MYQEGLRRQKGVVRVSFAFSSNFLIPDLFAYSPAREHRFSVVGDESSTPENDMPRPPHPPLPNHPCRRGKALTRTPF